MEKIKKEHDREETPLHTEVKSEPSPKAREPKKTESDNRKREFKFLKNIIFWQITSVLFLILFIVSLFVTFSKGNDIQKNEAKEKVQDYVNTILRGQAAKAVLGDIEEEKGLYKLKITIQGQTISTYITKDGSLFFPNVVDLNKFKDLVATLPVMSEGDIPSTINDEEEEIARRGKNISENNSLNSKGEE